MLRAVSNTWQSVVVSGRYVVSLASRATTSYASGADLPWHETASRTGTSAFTYDGCGNLTRETVTDLGVPGVFLSDNRSAFHAFGGGCTTHRVCAGQCERVQSATEVNGLQKTYAYDARGNPTGVTTLGPGTPRPP